MVDRTVHHSRYVSERMTDTLRDDIRILKSFLRACHTYGDRCPIGHMGFTGYSLELLVLQFGGLTKALKAIECLETQPVDPLRRSLEVLRTVPTFRDDHVYIIDPTDTKRNTAASFDPRAYTWTKSRISTLTDTLKMNKRELSLAMLIESPIPTDRLPQTVKDHAMAIEYNSDRSVHYTILRDKLHSLARRIRQSLTQEQTGEERFGMVLSEVYLEEDAFALGFLFENPVIPDKFERRGPPLSIDDAVTKFKKHHSKTFERDSFIWTTITREWTDAKLFITTLVEKSHIKGLELQDTGSEVSSRVLNILYRYVLPIEPDFTLRGQEFKE